MLSRSSHSHWVLWSEALGYRRLASSSSHGRVTSYHATTSGTLQYWSRTRAVLILFSVVLYNISTVSHSFILSKHFILVLVWIWSLSRILSVTMGLQFIARHRVHIYTHSFTPGTIYRYESTPCCVCVGGAVWKTPREPGGNLQGEYAKLCTDSNLKSGYEIIWTFRIFLQLQVNKIKRHPLQ